MPTPSTRHRQHVIAHGVLLALLVLLFAALTFGSKQLSLTADEPPHIAHGYLMLRTGDTWALRAHRHPPLLNMWSAWPLLLQPERPNLNHVPGWQADFVLFVHNLWPLLGPVERMAFVTRLPNILLAVILAALVGRWAKETSAIAAIVGVTVMVADPTLMGHAQLATTDLGVTLFTVAVLYLASRARPGIAMVLGLGFVLGAAIGAKGSALILVPIVAILLGFAACQEIKTLSSNKRAHGLIKWVLFGVGALGVSLVVLWASYGFQLEATNWSRVRLPLAGHIDMVRLILSEKHRTAFLAGELRQGGWWWYFPFAFLIKTPVPQMILLGAAIIYPLVHRRSAGARGGAGLVLWLYPAIHAATAISSGMNIGFRHLMPMFPFGYIAISRLCRALRMPLRANSGSKLWDGICRWAPAGTLSALLLWQAAEAARVYPFGLAYFNQLVGGAEQGYRYLVDSNLDWGQSFKALTQYMDQHQIPSVKLSHFTWIDPAAYGVRYEPLPPARSIDPTFDRRFDPPPGVYALSATPLQGVMMADPDLYAWFRQQEPVAQLGYGLHIYEVKPHSAEPNWLAQCTIPAPPLTDEAIESGFGRAEMRQIYFNCTQGWILPEGGRTPGWYAIHGALHNDPFMLDHIQQLGATLRYQQSAPAKLAPFDLYWQQQGAISPQVALDIPVGYDGLTLLGHSQVLSTTQPGETLEIETWWRVEITPARPLSLMLHLGMSSAPPISVGDGLAVPVEQWRAGDQVIQHHSLQVPDDAETGDYIVTTGVYWLDSLERWTITSGDHTGSDAVTLASIEITQ